MKSYDMFKIYCIMVVINYFLNHLNRCQNYIMFRLCIIITTCNKVAAKKVFRQHVVPDLHKIIANARQSSHKNTRGNKENYSESRYYKNDIYIYSTSIIYINTSTIYTTKEKCCFTSCRSHLQTFPAFWFANHC